MKPRKSMEDIDDIITRQFTIDASNNNSYSKLIRELDRHHPREDYTDETGKH